MRIILFVICLSVFCISNSTVFAADKIVVIPLGGAKNFMYWQGEWSLAGENYKIGDGVQYEGSSFVCVEAHTSSDSTPPLSSVYWDLLALKGDKGDSGAAAAGQSCSADKYVSGFDDNGDIICEYPPKYVFLTKALYNGDLGGIAGANEKCQTEADTYYLSGRYKAWISDSSTNPAVNFRKSQGRYITTHRETVAPY